jgi:hypothetical protein
MNHLFYNPKIVNTKWQYRIDLGYGANKFLYITGNSQINDYEILEAVLKNKNIDVNNIFYDFEASNEFTWNYREIVEIKKRKRRMTRFYRPTAKVIQNLASARAWQIAK